MHYFLWLRFANDYIFTLSYIITGWFVRFMYVQDVSKLSLNVFGILNI